MPIIAEIFSLKYAGRFDAKYGGRNLAKYALKCAANMPNMRNT